MTQQASKRPTCPTCLRPQRTCICHWIVPTTHAVDVLILQHPMEAHNAKGSARLLHLSLTHSRLVIGEVFPEPLLEELLFSQGDIASPPHLRTEQSIQPVLLYPDNQEEQAGMSQQQAEKFQASGAAKLRLVVLDATWRKSRKMLHLNPLLQSLPRLSLRDAPASQYRIRKAHAPDQLSSFEAACHALMQLDMDKEKYLPMLQAFSGFVTQQSEYQAGSGGNTHSTE